MLRPAYLRGNSLITGRAGPRARKRTSTRPDHCESLICARSVKKSVQNIGENNHLANTWLIGKGTSPLRVYPISEGGPLNAEARYRSCPAPCVGLKSTVAECSVIGISAKSRRGRDRDPPHAVVPNTTNAINT